LDVVGARSAQAFARLALTPPILRGRKASVHMRRSWGKPFSALSVYYVLNQARIHRGVTQR
jgi:hypothetical protein